ncbi:uncharacterized protein [Littorina saxatilis]|uniref:CABIT domain-containing protein n=1 Tax=Littorina saxatilis TaxID=31220 RepID=A0AAN9B8K6_9CAEN
MNRQRKNSDQAHQQQQEPSSPSPPSSPAVPPPPLEWEDTPRCLGPILRHNSLPLVVMCDKRGLPSMESVNFDFSQPLLLHTRRTVRKVVASSILHVKNEGVPRLEEVGDRLLVPEDYKGWFAVLGPPEGVKPEKVVPHFRQVAQLALSKCERFLIGGSEPVAAVTLPSSGNSDNSRAQPRLVYPGDVLRMGKLYVGESTIKVKKKFGGKKMVKKEEKFLMCTDDKDREVYLPVESRGTFYMLTTDGNGTPKLPIMQMPDICTRFRFPCVVKLLFGRVPTTPCSFTGTMVLLDSQVESSVIGCTMVNLRNILLDIPIDSDLKFLIAKGTLELLSSKSYKSAKALCHDKAATYMRNMKVAFYIQGEDEPWNQAAQSSTEAVVAEEVGGAGTAAGGGTTGSSPVTKRSDSVHSVSRARSMSCSQPSIVEDQELYCPPEAAPSSPALPTFNQTGKKSRKSLTNPDVGSGGDLLSPSISTNSPTVLRKDQTYILPEQQLETLPPKPAKSASSLNMENRPLPPVVPSPLPSNSLPDGHYMTMEETDQAPRKAPMLPPKPGKSRPLDGCVYTQLWNGETNASRGSAGERDSNAAALSPNSPLSPSALRPNNLSIPNVSKIISSLTVTGSYLTLPMFKTGDSPSTPKTPGRCGSPASKSPRNHDSGYLTPTFPSESEYRVPSSLPKLPSPPKTCSFGDQQEYETMESVSKAVNGATGQKALIQVRLPPPPPPPKPTNNHAYSNVSDVGFTKSKPLPPLPPLPPPALEAELPGIVFANEGLSDTSSLRSSEWNSFRSGSGLSCVPDRTDSLERAGFTQMSPGGGYTQMSADGTHSNMSADGGSKKMSAADGEYQNMSDEVSCKNVSAMNAKKKKGADADYMGMQRDSSFTYYEGYDPQNPVTEETTTTGRADSTEKQDSEASYENSMEKTSSAGDSDEILYENVQNLRLCKSRSDSNVSDPSDGNNNNQIHGHFLDKVVNSAASFGYMSPPPARALTPKRRPFTKTPAVDVDGPPDVKPSHAGSIETDAGRPPPTPPKPCGGRKNISSFSYLQASSENGSSTNLSTKGSDKCAPNKPTLFPRNRSSEGDLSQEQVRPASQDYDASSSASFEDDLPLGATFANFRSRLSDSGCAFSSVVGQRAEEGDSAVSILSVADLGEALKTAGLMKDTVDTLRREKVDGRLLVSMDEEELKEALPNIKKLEIKKIRMFVNGWRLME